MADFPNAIFEPRTTENKDDAPYVPEETTKAFAEDYSLPAAEIVAIEETLGINPEGEFETVGERIEALEDAPGPEWGGIGGSLSAQTDLVEALAGKENALGYTPENVANKSTDTSLGTSNTLYPTQNAVKTYADTKAPGAAAVPTGGSTGQVLTKDSGTDYDTSWQTPGGGGSTGTPTNQTGSRALGTVYQNTSGKPMLVQVWLVIASTFSPPTMNFETGSTNTPTDLQFQYPVFSGRADNIQAVMMVPNNYYYRVRFGSGSGSVSLGRWWETVMA
jgi:hypothetical protein